MVDKSQIKIRFFTREEDQSLHVDDTPLYVPISLKRYGLSEIINHLIGNETNPSPFEFLINGTLLRSSIEEYLVENGLSSEAFLSLEYTKAVLPPSFLGSFNNEDWVSSLDSINGEKLLSGSYDGIVRTWNMSGNVEFQFGGHSAAVKAVRWISSTRIVSAGNDRQVRLWKIGSSKEQDLDEEEPADGKTVAILEGHTAPVNSLAVHENRILSASSDHSVGLWSTNHKEMTAVDVTSDPSNSITSTAAKKRRKLALQDASIRRRSPLSLLESHNQPVEDIIFSKVDTSIAYSVSQDHTIKTWDLVTSRCVDTRTTGFSLLSITSLAKVNLLACGSSARHITLHDPRVSSTNITQQQLIGHRNFVVSLDSCPYNDYMLASGSHDGTVKIWDIRSTKSLYTITRESDSPKGKDKVFAIDWNEIGIISGGQDKKIQINKGTELTKAI